MLDELEEPSVGGVASTVQAVGGSVSEEDSAQRCEVFGSELKCFGVCGFGQTIWIKIKSFNSYHKKNSGGLNGLKVKVKH